MKPDDYPAAEFERSTASAMYRQISNFSVRYLDVFLHHLIEDESLERSVQPVLNQLKSRKRSIRHGFQFQLEKNFNDWKSTGTLKIRRSLLFSDSPATPQGLARKNNTQQIVSLAAYLEKPWGDFLTRTNKRLKTLTYRRDSHYSDMPVSPISLCNAFNSSIDLMSFEADVRLHLLNYFSGLLEKQLESFYQQLEFGFHTLEILPELTDLQLLEPEENSDITITQFETHEISLLQDNATIEIDTFAVDEVETGNLEDKATSNSQPDENATEANNNVDPQILINQQVDEFIDKNTPGQVDISYEIKLLRRQIKSLLSREQKHSLRRLEQYYSSLGNHKFLHESLKIHLSKLCIPMLRELLNHPFLFRASEQPEFRFIRTVIDFELRHRHDEQGCSVFKSVIEESISVQQNRSLVYQVYFDWVDRFEENQRKLGKIRDSQERKFKKAIFDKLEQLSETLVLEQGTMEFMFDDWFLVLFNTAMHTGMESNEFKQHWHILEALSAFLPQYHLVKPVDATEKNIKTILNFIDKELNKNGFSQEHRYRIRKQLSREMRLARKDGINRITAY